MAGGITVQDESLQRPFLADSHSHPIPEETLDLLGIRAGASRAIDRSCWSATTGLTPWTKFLTISRASGRALTDGRKESMTRLLDRQLKLLEYLTSGGAIFPGPAGAALPPALQGIDPGLLHLEARFSHEKRMEKIAAVFPVDLRTAGRMRRCDRCEASSTHVRRLISAGSKTPGSFTNFSTDAWKTEPPMPRYLPDVAACELACATVRVRSRRR